MSLSFAVPVLQAVLMLFRDGPNDEISMVSGDLSAIPNGAFITPPSSCST